MLAFGLIAFGLSLLCSVTDAQVPTEFGVFVGPPVPIAGKPYSIRVTGATAGPPITVDSISVATVGSNVEVTYFLTHGNSSSSPAIFTGTTVGPQLPPGQYTIRIYTRDRFSVQSEYGAPGPVIYTSQMTVAPSSISGVAVEFFNSTLNHYFMTASKYEIAVLDQGAIPGWSRTGQTYAGVYLFDVSAEPSPPLSSVCRYLGLPSVGLYTHFFSGFPNECLLIPQLWPNSWVLETMSAFYVFLPRTSDGQCPDGTLPVYRLFNQRPDANHRYATTLAIRQRMIDQSWIPEGYGLVGVVMCISG